MNADNSSYIRELKRAEQKEKDYLRKRAKRKTTLLNALAEDRVPKEIQSKLNEAFCKAFQVIFDRGMPAVERTIIGEGTEIFGRVYNSVIGCDVTIERGAEVRDSILMNGTHVGAGCRLHKVIAAENVTIGEGAALGEGYDIPNDTRPDIYREGIVTLGEGTIVPKGVSIGKNVMISGETTPEDYPGSRLESGRTLVKEGDVQ